MASHKIQRATNKDDTQISIMDLVALATALPLSTEMKRDMSCVNSESRSPPPSMRDQVENFPRTSVDMRLPMLPDSPPRRMCLRPRTAMFMEFVTPSSRSNQDNSFAPPPPKRQRRDPTSTSLATMIELSLPDLDHDMRFDEGLHLPVLRPRTKYGGSVIVSSAFKPFDDDVQEPSAPALSSCSSFGASSSPTTCHFDVGGRKCWEVSRKRSMEN